LIELLGNAAYTQKLLSPAQAEKALGKSQVSKIAEFITKPEGAPTLVTSDDPRPAIGISANDFD